MNRGDYKAFIEKEFGRCSNPLLLLGTYGGLLVGDDFKVDPEMQSQLLKAAGGCVGEPSAAALYKMMYERWKEAVTGDGSGRCRELSTCGRLKIGAGSDNVLEFSLRLHPLLGVPIIPGSAIKGVTRHYCNSAWGQADGGFSSRGDYDRFLFGDTDDAGAICFHDAWITPETATGSLVQDVMTPHHPEWQVKATAPSDFDSPIPLATLSVRGRFFVAVSWPQTAPAAAAEEKAKWLDLAMKLVSEALDNWGVGGKTTSGYGRLREGEWLSLPQTGASGSAASFGAAHGKRNHGTQVKLKYLGAREGDKQGHRAQEDGREPGLLCLDKPPGNLPAIGEYFDGFIRDDAKNPQYLWNKPAQKAPARTVQNKPVRR